MKAAKTRAPDAVIATVRGVILSHTAMGSGRFCTNIAVPHNGGWKQIRPRTAPNGHLNYDLMGFTLEAMEEHWQQEHWVDVPPFIRVAPAHRRATHPEDYVVRHVADIVLYSNVMSHREFLKLIGAFTKPTLQTLFPGLQNSRGKAYIPDGTAMPCSVGYIPVQRAVLMRDDWDKLRVSFTDTSGAAYCLPLKSVRLLKTTKVGHVWNNVLLRVSLAGSMSNDAWIDSPHPNRCFAMVSEVVERLE